MTNKGDQFYYQNFIDAAEYACRAAAYLNVCLQSYDPALADDMLEKMHEIEHLADEKKHEMSIALAKAFITPFDREDLAELSQNIDDVTDKIEEVLQRFYIDDIKRPDPDALVFAEKIGSCCQMMKRMLGELSNFKRPEKLRRLIIEVSHAEEECDQLYLSFTAKVVRQAKNPLDVLFWREIYDYMENCADACEHVADSVETIVMKNT